MISILGVYMSRIFLARLLLILFSLAAIAILLDLMANGDDILETGNDVAKLLAKYALLRLPVVLSQIIPITVLLAALLTFAGLARHSELTAILGAGLSPFKQLGALLPAVVLVGVVQFVIEDRAVPSATGALRDWGVGDYGDFAARDANDMTWFRQGDNFVRVNRTSGVKDTIRDITIFHRDSQGQLLERIQAQSATYKGGNWLLRDVIRTKSKDGTVVKLEKLAWPDAIKISILHSLTLHPKELSWAELQRLASSGGFGNRPAYLYEMWIHKKIARAVATVLMVLLAIACVQRMMPRRQPGLMLAAGIVAGFLYWICDELVVTIGEAGLLPPMVAAWTPALVLAAVASTLILRDYGT
jgi:lipopolysaccharide export system permease protein